VLAEAGAETSCTAGARLHAGRSVLWIHPTACSIGDGDSAMTTALPLAAGFFLRARDDTGAFAQPTSAMAIADLRDGLVEFHRHAAASIAATLTEHDRARAAAPLDSRRARREDHVRRDPAPRFGRPP
jgi:hypothetical protein